MRIPELHQLFLQHPQVCTDTRKITSGSIFFALKGDHFNGNQFAAKAIESGCSYAVIDEQQYAGEKTILVENVLETLQALATYHRQYWGKTMVAITGSNGKTTTKELIHSVLGQQYRCLATVGNLNNHIGVPLTLLSLKPEHEIAVVEMGANHQREIDQLCNIAQPNYGLITNAGKAHLEGFGGEAGVLKGKGEMYDYLRQHDGLVFINEDDEKLKSILGNLRFRSYGFSPAANVRGRLLTKGIFLEMEITNDHQTVEVHTQLTGNYNAINVLCAAAVGTWLGVTLQQVKQGIEGYVPDNSRSQVQETGRNTLILDAYNANPSSMGLAIENLQRLQANHKFFVVGDMREMGTYATREHEAILEKLKASGLNGILVGQEFHRLANTYGFTSFEEVGQARAYLQQANLTGYTILIKGSRGIKLENVVDVL